MPLNKPNPSPVTPLVLLLAALGPALGRASDVSGFKPKTPRVESKASTLNEHSAPGHPVLGQNSLARERLQAAKAQLKAQRTGKPLPQESARALSTVVAPPGHFMERGHPFLATRAVDRPGSLVLFSPSESGQQPAPRCLVHTADGWLYWLEEDNVIRGLSYRNGQLVPTDRYKVVVRWEQSQSGKWFERVASTYPVSESN